MTFSGVASNFAGVPLALAFVFTVGQLGLVTKLLADVFGYHLWRDDFFGGNFSLYSMLGLVLVYLYFQFPLMVLIVAPAIDGLRKEWREAAENMGASSFQYWRHVALPILLPSLLGSMILLFGNAFGAQATAYQLTGGTINIVPLVISAQIRGDVLHNPNLGYALAMGMVVIMAVVDPDLRPAPAALRAVAAVMSRFGAWWAWLIFIIAALYMLVPLVATFQFSLQQNPTGEAYRYIFNDPKFFAGLGYSFLIALITIVISLLIIVPTAYWVRLKLPRLRPVVEFMTLLPFVVPPIILVFGLIRSYGRPPLAITSLPLGSDAMLVGAYVVLSFPYMYRAVDTGLASIDVRSLTEAAQSMGSGWPRILLSGHLPEPSRGPPVRRIPDARDRHRRVHHRQLPRPAAFGPYLSLLGGNKAWSAAAVSLISFVLTWAAMGSPHPRVSRQRWTHPGRRTRTREPRAHDLPARSLASRSSSARWSPSRTSTSRPRRASSSSFLGPSGCGKTTTLRMIAGFETPTGGTIVLDGEDITYRPPNKRNVGMVFQSYALFPNMTVAENIGFGLRVRKRPSDQIKKRVARAARADPPPRQGRPVPVPAVGRPAAARRAGPRPGLRARGAAARRASVCARRQDPRLAPPGDPRDPAPARNHHGLRDPRPGGGARRCPIASWS